MRPAVVIKYEYPLQSATNNVVNFKDAIDHAPIAGALPPDERQVVVVSNIGQGGDVIAMERARNGALLALQAGEVDPRLYVRKASQEWQADKTEVFVLPKTDWDDKAFLYTMTSESLILQPLGGVLKSEVARMGMDQVFERRIPVPKGNLSVSLRNALASVGWGFEGYSVPASQVEGFTVYISLSESGKATAVEATEIVRSIVNTTSAAGLDIRADVRRRVVEVYGELAK
ncbi:MAG: hypothetical protein MHMPM18_004567 [Marteilia pararefringens]